MTNKTIMYGIIGNMKKAMVVSMASLMMLQTCATPVYAASDNALVYNLSDQGALEDISSGLIKKAAGKIPVVGDYMDIFLDPILKMIFGTEDEISSKLEEIYDEENEEIDIDDSDTDDIETINDCENIDEFALTDMN